MIRRVLLSAVSGVALVSPAFGADIYSPGPATYAAVVLPPSWAGFYLGANGGYGGGSGIGSRDAVSFTGTPPAGEYSNLGTSSTIAGGFGGGQLGYNFQIWNFVYGIETDIQGANIMGSGGAFTLNPSVGNAAPYCGAVGGGGAVGACAARNDLQVDWFGTVRGRLGYAFGGTLLYATGGLAYGGVRSAASYIDNSSGTPSSVAARVSNTSTATGWVAGAGVEYKLSPSWSLKGEYQYVDLGSLSEGPVPALSSPDCVTRNLRAHNNDVAFNTVRVGVNYYFNAPYVPLK